MKISIGLTVLAAVVVLGAGVAAQAAPKIVLVAGGGSGGAGSSAKEAMIKSPFGVVHDAQGRLLIVEYASRIEAIDADGKVVVVAGDGVEGKSGDGGPALQARFKSPHSLDVGADGAIYVADSFNDTIRKVDPKTGVISLFAGAAKGFSGDGGPADKANFSGTYCVAFNRAKDKMIVTDLDNRRIRVIDMKTNVVTTVAGNGKRGVPEDGADATAAPLVDPRAATMDSKGNLYVVERGGHALRVVDAAGKIKTLIPGPAAPKGPHVLNGPKHLWIDQDDNVLIVDTENHRIVKWLVAEGKLVPVAGTGVKGKAGVGGPPEQVQLNRPHGAYTDAKGTLYISDSDNDRVLKIEE